MSAEISFKEFVEKFFPEEYEVINKYHLEYLDLLSKQIESNPGCSFIVSLPRGAVGITESQLELIKSKLDGLRAVEIINDDMIGIVESAKIGHCGKGLIIVGNKNTPPFEIKNLADIELLVPAPIELTEPIKEKRKGHERPYKYHR